jgi:hypothetical protein
MSTTKYEWRRSRYGSGTTHAFATAYDDLELVAGISVCGSRRRADTLDHREGPPWCLRCLDLILDQEAREKRLAMRAEYRVRNTNHR